MARINKSSFCTCTNVTGIYVEQDMWGYWEYCCACKKRIENSYTYYSEDYTTELNERDD